MYVQHTKVDREAGASALVLIRFEEKPSIRRALKLLADCALEVYVKAREVQGVHVPAQVEAKRCAECGAPETDHPYRHPFRVWAPSREAEGARWNG